MSVRCLARVLEGLLPGLALAFLALLASPLVAELGEAELRGRQIFLEGTSPRDEPIVARIADGGVEVPASVMPCASCHGRDGRGRPEGGIRPSNLTWPALTRPEAGGLATRRSHPPYSERSVKRAITLGSDPAGNRLHAAMPRYQMTHADLADLVSYLRQLGSEEAPGVDRAGITLWTLRPVSGPAVGPLREVDRALTAALAEINEQGGIYGRRIRVRPLPFDPEAPESTDWRRELEGEDGFALLAPWAQGSESQLAELASELSLPVIAPLTLAPPEERTPDPWVFYLLPGLADQVEALVVAGARGSGRLWVVDGGGRFEPLTERALAKASEAGWSQVEAVSPGELEAVVGSSSPADAVLLLAEGAARRVALEGLARRAGPEGGPRLLIPGPLVDGETLARSSTAELLAAFPTAPPPEIPEVWQRLRRRDPSLPPVPTAFQAVAVAALDLLVTGLRSSGRTVDRWRLVAELEGLRDHDTGLLPPLSFGPNRRVALQGGYLVAFSGGQPLPRGWFSGSDSSGTRPANLRLASEW